MRIAILSVHILHIHEIDTSTMTGTCVHALTSFPQRVASRVPAASPRSASRAEALAGSANGAHGCSVPAQHHYPPGGGPLRESQPWRRRDVPPKKTRQHEDPYLGAALSLYASRLV